MRPRTDRGFQLCPKHVGVLDSLIEPDSGEREVRDVYISRLAKKARPRSAA